MFWLACSAPVPEEPLSEGSEAPAEDQALPPIAHTLRTTRPDVAVQGLDARIDSLVRTVDRVPTATPALLDALGLRMSLFGHLSDLDRIFGFAGDGPLRARALLAVHRFDDALAADPEVAESVQLARHEGLDVLEAQRRERVGQHPSTKTWMALADVLLAQGRPAEADAAYHEALAAYRDVSPLTVADIQFRRGMAWGESGEDPERARQLYGEAVKHLPTFVRAQVHLAELEWEAGEHASAIARVRKVAAVQDPEPAGKLAVWLEEPEATEWRNRSTTAYNALLTKYPLAFADHAAEYFSDIGDMERARELAAMDLTNRATPRSIERCEALGCAPAE